MNKAINAFEIGVRNLGAYGDPVNGSEARRAFEVSLQEDPMMCDAWMGLANVHAMQGEMMPGDLVFGAYKSRRRRGDQVVRMRLPRQLAGRVAHLDFGLTIPVTSSDDILVAQALEAARHGDRKEAAILLTGEAEDPSSPIVQFTYLMLLRDAKRWDEVEAFPWHPLIGRLPELGDGDDLLMMATKFAIAEATAYLGRLEPALGFVEDLQNFIGQDAARRPEREVFWPELAYLRGLVLRELGLTDPKKAEEAQSVLAQLVSFRGQVEKYRVAVNDPTVRLELVTPEILASRTDVWDPTTQVDRHVHVQQKQQNRRDELLAKADELMNDQIGMPTVKKSVEKLRATMLMNRRRIDKGLNADARAEHMVFVGPPGTGKTTTAKAIGLYMAGLGVVNGDNFIEASRSDFVGEHLGSTAPKTTALIKSALDGVLFIDEAYTLIQTGLSGGDAFGREAVDVLLKLMDEHRDRLVVIIAGYEGEITRFLASNEGLASRFTRTLEFPSYTAGELTDIARVMAERQDARLGEGTQQWLTEQMQWITETHMPGDEDKLVVDKLGNGRFIRTLLEKSAEERDFRFVTSGVDLDALTAEQMMTIETADINEALRTLLAGKGIRRG